jgi:hypothetical protein
MKRKLLALVVAAAALTAVGIGGAAAAPTTGPDAGASHAANDTDTTRLEEDELTRVRLGEDGTDRVEEDDIVLLDSDTWSRLDDGRSSVEDDATDSSVYVGADNFVYADNIPERTVSDRNEPEYDEKLTADESFTLDFEEEEVTRQGDGIYVVDYDDEE